LIPARELQNIEQQQNNKGQKDTWVSNGVTKHKGAMKHHATMMHQRRVVKQKEQ
jgi:hypothetical protein